MEQATSVASEGASEPPYPPARQAWTACIILTVGCILAFMDRGILSLFVMPMQRDLGLSDTQISLLIGYAFAVFNAIFGLPVARLVDSGSRRIVATTGIFAWSVANALCGFATNFWQLMFARIGVGAGEAAVSPAGVSLLADYFPPHRRGLAMGVFYSGMYLGGAGVLLVGGLLFAMLGDRSLQLPVVGSMHSWQVILVGFGLLGLIVGPLTLMIKEPERRHDGMFGGAALPVSTVLRFYNNNRRTLLGHNLGFCMMNLAVHAGVAWFPAILMRTQGWSLPQAGLAYGMILVLVAPLGTIAGGLLADVIVANGRRDARLLVAIMAALGCGASSIVLGLAEQPVMVITMLVFITFFTSASQPQGPGSLQDIMPNVMRGQATAIYVFFSNVLGAGTGITLVAIVTQYVFKDGERINEAFALVSSFGCLTAAAIYVTTLPHFRRLSAAMRNGPDLEDADEAFAAITSA